MRSFVVFSSLLISLNGLSFDSPTDSSKFKQFIRDIDFCINAFELGGSIAFKQSKLTKLNYGLDKYYSKLKGDMHFSFFGLSFYYKKKFGLGAMFTDYEFISYDMGYNDYLTQKYPNHFIPEHSIHSILQIQTFSLNASYRQKFKYFTLEPKFRVCFNSFNSNNESFRLKEKGSNQYIQFELNEQIKSYKNNYIFILALFHQFNTKSVTIFNLEVGVQAELVLTPVKSVVTVTETPYNMPSIVYSENISLLNPALAFGVFLNMKFGD
jgi:hypothetical protein